ncbi:hypothetical protein V6N13_114797 [Hibiscus sabdariffa]
MGRTRSKPSMSSAERFGKWPDKGKSLVCGSMLYSYHQMKSSQTGIFASREAPLGLKAAQAQVVRSFQDEKGTYYAHDQDDAGPPGGAP